MSLRTQTPLTEYILATLAEFSDLIDIPRSVYQVVHWDEHQYFKERGRKREQIMRERKRVQKALWNLESAAVITAQKDSKGRKKYRLSPKGWLKFAAKYARRLKGHERERRGNGDFKQGNFVIIFDIPETYRQFRDILRKVLYQSGCVQLQKSIFMTPSYKTAQFIARVVTNSELEDRVKILLVKSIL